jgi:hypothetical protein
MVMIADSEEHLTWAGQEEDCGLAMQAGTGAAAVVSSKVLSKRSRVQSHPIGYK